MSQRTLTSKQVLKLHHLLENTVMEEEEVADNVGCSLSTVYRYKRAREIERPDRRTIYA